MLGLGIQPLAGFLNEVCHIRAEGDMIRWRWSHPAWEAFVCCWDWVPMDLALVVHGGRSHLQKVVNCLGEILLQLVT